VYISAVQHVHVSERRPRWTVATARRQLPALLGAAAREPQRVYKRNKLVATVVSPEVADRVGARPSLADSLGELQRLCAQEEYELPEVVRRDRPVPSQPRRRKR
jgi:hypothetical protein